MVKIRRSGQDWILDRFIGALGVDALMPDFMEFMTSPVVGFNASDLARIAEATRGVQSMRRAYERTAEWHAEAAREADERGNRETARRHHHQAALGFGFAQYLIQEDGSAEKQALQRRVRDAYDRIIDASGGLVRRLEVPFSDDPAYDGTSFPALLHLPPDPGPHPCVVFLPGTDMIKEQVPNPEDNIFAKRGMACLSIDGPGQGESLVRNLKVRVDTWNYERAVSAAIDVLVATPEVDPGRIAVFGVSTGSYWAARAAVHEARHGNRVRAAAGLAAQWQSGFVTEYEYAQPNFKTNYMYMAGIDDESEFDRLAPLNTLDGLMREITCPVLMAQGEFDELCSPAEVRALLEQMTTRYELRIYEDQFHPLGPVAAPAYEGVLDWVRARLDGEPLNESRVVTVASPRL